MHPFDAPRSPEINVFSTRLQHWSSDLSRPTSTFESVLLWRLRQVAGFPNLRREVEGQVLIAQEHQPSPPELDVRLVTACAKGEYRAILQDRFLEWNEITTGKCIA